jgi:hypothetical protein
LGYSSYEMLQLEAGSRGTGTVREPRGRGKSAVESRYRATAIEDAYVDISGWVTVNCKMQSRAVSNSPVNPVINPKPVYSHVPSRDVYAEPNFFNVPLDLAMAQCIQSCRISMAKEGLLQHLVC